MIAPRRLVRFRGREYGLEQRGEAWAIIIEGNAYFLTAADDPERVAPKFFDARMRNVPDPRRPGFIASYRYPLLIIVDRVLVRAWPGFVTRGRGAATFINQATGNREATLKEDPEWILAARGRKPSAAGTVTAEQTVDDVLDMARVWLRDSR